MGRRNERENKYRIIQELQRTDKRTPHLRQHASLSHLIPSPNTLPLEDRKRHENKPTTCQLCKEETENLEHFIMECKQTGETRNQIPVLQRPHNHSKEDIMKDFLFTEEGQECAERREEWLYELWRARKKALKI